MDNFARADNRVLAILSVDTFSCRKPLLPMSLQSRRDLVRRLVADGIVLVGLVEIISVPYNGIEVYTRLGHHELELPVLAIVTGLKRPLSSCSSSRSSHRLENFLDV